MLAYGKKIVSQMRGKYLVAELIIFLTIMFIFLTGGKAFALTGAGIEWAYDYGDNGVNSAQSVQQTDDGGFIVVGDTIKASSHKKEIYLLKLDSQGILQWEKTIGSKGDNTAKDIEQTTDGGYIITGYSSRQADNGNDIYVLKTDARGIKSWEQLIGARGDDQASCVKQNSDGTYIIAAYSESREKVREAILIKLNNNGVKMWEKRFSGNGFAGFSSVCESSDNSFIAAGYTASSNDKQKDVFLLKIGENGDFKWEKTFGGKGGDDVANNIIQAADGTYILLGYKEADASGKMDVYLLKTSISGELCWENSFGASYKNTGRCVEETADGGFIILANTYSYGTPVWGAYLVKTDASGRKVMEKTFGRDGPDFASWGQQTYDAYYVIAGSKNVGDPEGKNAYLMKLNLRLSFVQGSQKEKQAIVVEANGNSANSQSEKEVNENLSEGGILWPDMSEYRGQLLNGKAHGKGNILFPDGGRYDGEWKNNMFNGYGTLTTPDGNQYTGNFRDHMFYGQGVYIWRTGEKYEGEFIYNKMDGKGFFTWPGGVEYSGEFRNGEANGYGTIIWPNGEKYTGQMAGGQASGLGTYLFSNGEKYVGQFSSLTFDGLGTYYWSNGAMYVGEFTSDMMNGQGTYIWPNGVQQWGYWLNDRYIGLYPEDGGN